MAGDTKPGERPRASELSLPEKEALLAKAALAATARKLRHDLLRTVKPTVWARRHPWVTVSLSALTGFAAGAVAAKPPHLDAEGRARLKHNVQRGRRLLASVISIVMPAVRMGRAAARRFSTNGNGHAYDFGEGDGAW